MKGKKLQMPGLQIQSLLFVRNCTIFESRASLYIDFPPLRNTTTCPQFPQDPVSPTPVEQVHGPGMTPFPTAFAQALPM